MLLRIIREVIKETDLFRHTNEHAMLLSFFLLLISYGIDTTETSRPLVETIYGKISGRTHHLDDMVRPVDVYLSIPFAAPPTGQLRFQFPQPPQKWEGVLEATNIPTPCWQNNDTTFGDDFRGTGMWNSILFPNEDCLYLNVYVPKNSNTINSSKLAVMVWIYGGGFYSGSSNLDIYDGKYFAAESNTIVVSMNYRLGPFGFFTLNNTQAPPNVGLRDQLMSLQWVQDNIAAFGGDPNNVTIFGESAGAVSVSLHLLSPLSRDKFNRAILQSGSAKIPIIMLTMVEALNRSKSFLKALECLDVNENISDINQTMNCMKGKPAQSITFNQWIIQGFLQFPFIPVIDGDFIPDDPAKLMERHEFKKCPILLGTNANEGSYFLIYEFPQLLTLDSISMTQEQYEISFNRLFSYYPRYPTITPEETLAAMKSLYNPSYTNESEYRNQLENIHALDMAVADSQFVCPVNSFARAYASAGQDVYAYYFNQRIVQHEWPEWMGVLHGDEILFVLGDALKYHLNYTLEERTLSRIMISYWSNFAKTGLATFVCI